MPDTNTGVTDTDPAPGIGTSTSGSDPSTSGDAAGTESPPDSMWHPSNVPGIDDGACHVPGEMLPESFLLATCVGEPIPEADDPDAYCLEGSQPFGSMVIRPGPVVPVLHFCPLDPAAEESEAHEFFSAPSTGHVLAVATRTEGGEVRIDALALAFSASTYWAQCMPADGEPFGQDDTLNPLPPGEIECGPMTIEEAEPGQPPIVSVEFEGETVHLQMLPQ